MAKDAFMEAPPEAARGGVLTIGNFDGVHVGHRRILATARAAADEAGVGVCALTFDPLPEQVLRTMGTVTDSGQAPGNAPCGGTKPAAVPIFAGLICPPTVRLERLRGCGVDWPIVLVPTPELLGMAAEAFVREVIVARFAPTAVVEGRGFVFGRGRSGDMDLLRRLGGDSGFDAIEVEPVELDLPGRARVRASSSLVRQLLAAGEVGQAELVLARPYELHGQVVGGERRGRALQFPTANVAPSGVLTPADGVYAAWADVGGRRHPAAVSIGTKPTFGPKPRTIEANLIDASGDFYGQPIVLTFLQRLRGQEAFPDAESLRQAIAKDVQRVRDICQ